MKYDPYRQRFGWRRRCYYATRRAVLMTVMRICRLHQQGSHHGDTRLIRHAYGEGENMSHWCFRAQREHFGDEPPHTNEEPYFVVNSRPADLLLANVARSAQCN